MELWHHEQMVPLWESRQDGSSRSIYSNQKVLYLQEKGFFCCYCKISHRGICFKNRKTQRLTGLNTSAGADLSLNISTGFCTLVWSLCFSSGWAPLPCPSYVAEYLCLVLPLLAGLTGCSSGFSPRPGVGTLDSILVFRHLL